jgi:hypothetical protein
MPRRSRVYFVGESLVDGASRQAVSLGRRWAAVHKAAKNAAQRRKMSAERKAALAANLAKASAARAAKKN